MTVLKGYESYIGFRELSTTAEVNTVPAEFIFADNISFTRTKEEEIVAELGIQNRTLRRRVTKNIEAAGSFTKKVDPNNGIALYQYLLGGSVTSASISSLTFEHTFSDGDEVPNATRLQFQVSLGGDSGTTLNFFNGIVESYSLAVAAGDIAAETFNQRFANHGSAVNTLSTVSLTQTPPINGQRVTVSLGATLTAVSVTAIKDLTLNITNALIENRELGTASVEDFLYDIKSVDGTFNATFENLTLYQQFLDETSTAMSIIMTSEDAAVGETSSSIKIDLPKVFFNGTTPDVGGTGEIVQPIAFSAIHGSNSGFQVQIKVQNQDSSVTK